MLLVVSIFTLFFVLGLQVVMKDNTPQFGSYDYKSMSYIMLIVYVYVYL